MSDKIAANDCCPTCGAFYALVGRAHNCKPLSSTEKLGVKPPVVMHTKEELEEALGVKIPDGDVNEVNTPQDTELTKPAPKKRGEYPNTDLRRQYMREYMMKKRRGKL
jgi:hypothetical protein